MWMGTKYSGATASSRRINRSRCKLIRSGFAGASGQNIVAGSCIDLGFYPDTGEVVHRGRNGAYPEIPSIPSAMDELISALQDFPIETGGLQPADCRGLDRLVNSPKVTGILDELHAATADVRRRMVGALEGQTVPAGREDRDLVMERFGCWCGRTTLLDTLNTSLNGITGDTHTVE